MTRSRHSWPQAIHQHLSGLKCTKHVADNQYGFSLHRVCQVCLMVVCCIWETEEDSSENCLHTMLADVAFGLNALVTSNLMNHTHEHKRGYWKKSIVAASYLLSRAKHSSAAGEVHLCMVWRWRSMTHKVLCTQMAYQPWRWIFNSLRRVAPLQFAFFSEAIWARC